MCISHKSPGAAEAASLGATGLWRTQAVRAGRRERSRRKEQKGGCQRQDRENSQGLGGCKEVR